MSASKEFTRLFKINGLNDTFTRYIKLNTAVGVDKLTYPRFVEHKDAHFVVINRKVNSGTYDFTPYKEVLILKGRNKLPRVISIPTIRDKVVLKSLQLVLAETFNVAQQLPQQHIQELKGSLDNFRYFIRLDITNFFGSISHGILMAKVQKRIRKNEILNLIQKAITTPNLPERQAGISQARIGVPQGLPISNTLAHVYISELDEKYKRMPGIKYFRYVDDILILCSDEKHARSIENQIKYDIEAILNLSLNASKESRGHISPDGFEFLGYRVKRLSTGAVGLTVKDSTKLQFENSIASIFTQYKYSSRKVSPKQFLFKLNNKITGSISSHISGDSDQSRRYGWLFYYSQIDDTGLLYHLDWYVQKLIDDFGFASKLDRDMIKSFKTAFYEIRYNCTTTDYIHRPDNLDVKERRKLLMDVFGMKIYQLESDADVDKLYYNFVYKPIKHYEKDLKRIIS